MEVKRFRASSMKEALEAVRQELGEEAIILKSDVLPRSGFFDFLKKDTVEVVAALDVPSGSRKSRLAPSPRVQSAGGRLGYFTEKPPSWSEKRGSGSSHGRVTSTAKPTFPRMLNQEMKSGVKRSQPSRRVPSQQRSPVSPRGTNQRTTTVQPSKRQRVLERRGVTTAERESIALLREEIRELRSAVKALTGRRDVDPVSLKDFADMPSSVAQEMMALLECGIEKQIAKTLIEKAAFSVPIDDAHNGDLLRETVIQEMTKMLKTAGPIKCQKGKTKVVALVGPTGVGKTTTLAKLAANSKFAFDKRVSLISADTYRMSAIEHLNTFAGIAHLPLSAVYSPEELKASLSAQQDKDLIFIDTAGRSPKDEKHLLELKRFMVCANPDEIHLVIPANIKNLDLLEVVRRFSVLPVNRIVVSKVDETNTLGTILNIAAEVDTPLSYITNGQTIPDDIELANSQSLARMIMRTA